MRFIQIVFKCFSKISQRSNLQSHKRATHYNDKRYKCDECGKGFKRRRLLDYHVKAAHTGERPYKCDVCTATFVYPEHFKKHRRIHTGEKPYQCEVRSLNNIASIEIFSFDCFYFYLQFMLMILTYMYRIFRYVVKHLTAEITGMLTDSYIVIRNHMNV